MPASSREELIRAALQRVLQSKYFAQAESLANLLRYLVEETLAGRGDTIKELTVGTEVFGRGPAFDPKTDGIVRVQASRLRSKLRDYYATEGRDDELVIAVPTGGYLPEFVPKGKAEAPEPPRAQRQWIPVAGAAVLLATITALGMLLGSLWKSRPPRIESVAVLPFRNLTGDAAQDYLADGLTDTLITDLGKIPGLRVISRTTAMSLADSKKTLTAVARELKVEALVEGSMTRSGGNIRVNVNLVEVRDRERNLWSQTLEHGDRNFASLQHAMYREVAAQIHPGSKPEPPKGSLPHPDAYVAYLKGRHLAGRGTEADIREALNWYDKAAVLDPKMALAKSSRAHAYVILSDFFMSPAEALPQAKAAAAEAVMMDPSSADAYAARGAAALFNDRDAQAAETNLREALRLNPNSTEAHRMFAVLCASMGRFDEAVAAARGALQLDPLSGNAYAWLQWILLVAGRNQEAEDVGRAGLQMFPDAPLLNLWTGGSIALRGEHHRAVPYFDKAAKFDQFPMMPLFLGLMHALNNDKTAARDLLAKAHKIGKRRYICAYEVASLHSALGEMDDAYEWMERGLGEHCKCFTWLMAEPWMKAFRADPRFPALAAKVGLWNNARSF